jgi:hypothetical protein
MATRRTNNDVQNITQTTKDRVKCIQTNQVRTEIVAKEQFGSKAITVHIDFGGGKKNNLIQSFCHIT